VLHRFDVDDFGIARAEDAQFIAYGSGIAFLGEELLPFVVGRPPAVAAVVPTGDPRASSASKCNAVGHCAFTSCSFRNECRGVHANFQRWRGAIVGIGPIGAKKRHMRAIRRESIDDG